MQIPCASEASGWGGGGGSGLALSESAGGLETESLVVLSRMTGVDFRLKREAGERKEKEGRCRACGGLSM